MPTRQGSLKLFTFAGIDVYVGWSWLFVAVIAFQYRTHVYHSLVWSAAEYLALFLIVLIHEFGHQLACRSVGGQTHDIVLSPIGGVAYVTPPQRAGAQLWSIVAGPLVNVVLIPILSVLVAVCAHLRWADTNPDANDFVQNVWWINTCLLIFNLLPIYPLDGGQILRSLLWFPFGRANSLLIATIIGFIGAPILLVLAVVFLFQGGNLWNDGLFCVMIGFLVLNCWGGLRQALALSRLAKLPRRNDFACPGCKAAPPAGNLWRCGKCGQGFDTFQTLGICPHCGAQYQSTQCLDCGASHPIGAWPVPPPLPPAA
jgi:Zn-dependent protease